MPDSHVEPDSYGAVTVRLPETTNCDTSDAICTSDGRPLSHSLSARVAGPAGISVAAARVEEDEGAVLAFVVTLSRAATSVVAADYATSDGSAKADVDYTAKSGTLSFQAGESSKTIEVTVLNDAHDEDEEMLTLTLSNASRGRLTDGEATGRIKNRDPLPRALLARFGRRKSPREDCLDLPVSVALLEAVADAAAGPGGRRLRARRRRGVLDRRGDTRRRPPEGRAARRGGARFHHETSDNPTVAPRRYDVERLPSDLRETALVYATVEALREVVGRRLPRRTPPPLDGMPS